MKQCGLTLFSFNFFWLFTATLCAQESEPASPASGNASQIYVELLGPGGLYSVNYDGRLGRKEKGLGVRLGFSAAYADGSGFLTFPLGLNYLAGSNGNYFEFGAGPTIATSSDVFEESGDETVVWGHLTLGYRRQAYRKKGITWRVAFTPVFGDGFFLPWVGTSIGYRF